MKKVLVAKPNYRKFSPTGYQMLLDAGYDVVCTDLDRDYFLEELLPMVGDIDPLVNWPSPCAVRTCIWPRMTPRSSNFSPTMVWA